MAKVFVFPHLNYIDLINNFWQKDIEFAFSDKEVSLYFYLLNTCNSIHWKNPFGLSNAMTIVKFGWGKTSFDTSKNRLKSAGLIDFKAGDGRGNVYQYQILQPKKVGVKGIQNIPLSVHLSNTLSDTLSKQKPSTSKNKKKKENIADSIESGQIENLPVSPPEEKPPPTEHWQQLVKIWFGFYLDNKKEKPSFGKVQAHALKEIVKKLKGRALEKKWEWSEQIAKETLRHFLDFAYKNEWLRNNFLLTNIESKFDIIITDANGSNKSTNTKGQQPVDGISAFNKFNQLNNVSPGKN